ncbi:hypothetical protein V6N12_057699 [Hibiscus sabdariffa]|uniref:Uncharacterized protein n=1 Tax=Hibiscus sabdariffa TaxID=183260 RepID=A0ABR2C5X0_9ROSI
MMAETTTVTGKEKLKHRFMVSSVFSIMLEAGGGGAGVQNDGVSGPGGCQVHKPNARIVCEEPNGDPAAGRDTYGVPLGGVDMVELCRILFGVKVSNTLSQYEEVKAMKRMLVSCNTNSTLVLKRSDTTSVPHDVFGWCACVVELEW